MSKNEEILNKKRKRLEWLEDRALPRASHYLNDAKERLKKAKSDVEAWSNAYNEASEEIAELEDEIDILEYAARLIAKNKSQPVSGSQEDHTGMSAWEATSGYEL